jgi:proteasome accessory factor A
VPQLRDSGSERKSAHLHDFARIFGIETEYGLSVTQTARRVDPSRAAMVMFEPVVRRQRATNTYLTNGSRLYLDVGSHPEYATSEARTPAAALAQDAAGEAVMKRLAASAQKELSSRLGEPNLRLHVYKNNLDAAGNSFGCHENYLLRRAVPLSVVERVLIPFLATRCVWAGAGHVVERAEGSGCSAGGVTYELTQRADVLDEAVSSATTRVRPMINTRDEPHANPDEFRRLHVIVGDSNRSQTSTWLRLATTHLVLCMIEQSVRENAGTDGAGVSSSPSEISEQLEALLSVLPSLTHDDPTALMKAASRGEHDAVRNAFTVQRLFCDAAAAFARGRREELISSGSIGDYELDEALRTWDEVVAAGEYEFTVAANADDDAQVLQASQNSQASQASPASQTRDASSTAFIVNLAEQMPAWVEWAAKVRLLEAFRSRHADAEVPRAALEQIELSYHDIAASTVFEGLAQQEDAQIRSMVGNDGGAFNGRASVSGLIRVSAREVKQAVSEPPMGTRAMVRGEFVRKALTSHVEWSCDWTHLEVHGSQAGAGSGTGVRRHEVRLFDPFDDDMFAPPVREVFAALDGE